MIGGWPGPACKPEATRGSDEGVAPLGELTSRASAERGSAEPSATAAVMAPSTDRRVTPGMPIFRIYQDHGRPAPGAGLPLRMLRLLLARLLGHIQLT